MRRSKVIRVLAAVIVGFLLLQFLGHKLLFREALSAKKEEQSREWRYHLFTLVHFLTSKCDHKNIPVFVIEPNVLHALATGNISQTSSRCRYLCAQEKLLSLGVLSSDWDKKTMLLQDLNQAGLIVREVIEIDPRYGPAGSVKQNQIPTHYFLRWTETDDVFLHLVVFYLRADNYLWHSGLKWTEYYAPYNSGFTNLTIGTIASAFDRFSLRKLRIDGLWIHVPHTLKEFLTQLPQSTFIECNHQRARQFFTKYGQNTSEEALLFIRKARQTLARAKEILDELEIRFWLSSGTCLGWYRQCDIIPYSKDVDLGIWIKDNNEEMIPVFENRGFTLKHIFGKESDSYELSFKSGDIKVDVFFFYEENGQMWNGGTQAKTGKKFKYYFPKFTLCWTEFLELRLRVPCETEAYVRANYGKNWFAPTKTWDWKKSPPNVQENGVWPKEELDSVLQVYE